MIKDFEYIYHYEHKTKRVTIAFTVGPLPKIEIKLSADRFITYMDMIRADKLLAQFISEVRKRKELSVDHDFGNKSDINFDAEKWGKKMEDTTK